MLQNNDIKMRLRIKELFFDWLMICAYLILLFIVNIGFSYLRTGNVFPSYTERTTQLIATFTSVVPIILWFSYSDYKGGTFGKKKAGLTIYFNKKSFTNAIIRNTIKFIPWQLGHMYAIRSAYYGYDRFSQILYAISVILFLIMLGMGLLRSDKRHLGDFLAGTQVQIKN